MSEDIGRNLALAEQKIDRVRKGIEIWGIIGDLVPKWEAWHELGNQPCKAQVLHVNSVFVGKVGSICG